MRHRVLLGAAAVLAAALASCDPPPLVGAGAPCNSLSDCKPGLTCIEGVCDEDISSIAGDVPSYAVAAAPAADAGVAPAP